MMDEIIGQKTSKQSFRRAIGKRFRRHWFL